MSATRDLILVGGGHAHVEVIRRFAGGRAGDLRLTLISRGSLAPYSGMLPGLVARRYTVEESHIDLRALCTAAGIRFLCAEANGLDLAARTVSLTDREPVPFDLLSIDIGSSPNVSAPGALEHAVAVKPIDRFLARLEALDRTVAADQGHRIAVVGAGAGGSELTLALRARYGARVALALVDAAVDPIPTHPQRARRLMREALATRGVALHLGSAVASVRAGAVALADGTTVRCDTVLWTTKATAPAWLAAAGLPVDDEGFVRVNATLQVKGHSAIFAAGDVIAFAPRALPKAGVYAVRAGPALAENLYRAAMGQPLRAFRPQRSILALLSTGDGAAIASKGPFAFQARWLFSLKDRIDRRWMAMYQMQSGMIARAPMPADAMTEMRCAGCAAKVGATTLRQALSHNRNHNDPAVLIGLDAPDDAAVVATRPGHAMVQSVDFFPAFIDDPWTFGRIAAVHAFGDLHAMGAEPVAALATAVVPVLHPRLQGRDLAAMIAGARSAIEAEGASLVGGHSAEGHQLGLGITATGTIDPAKVMRKSGLRAGDVLILTKPLGVGAVFAALMRGRMRGPAVQQALASMQRSLRPAAEAARRENASAATDVTGFGLAGHLLELLQASGVDAEISLDALPAFDAALDALRGGIESTAAPGNRAFAEPFVQGADSSDPARFALLFDPQTAGGLLFGVAPDRAWACLDELGPPAAQIGRVIPSKTTEPQIWLT